MGWQSGGRMRDDCVAVRQSFEPGHYCSIGATPQGGFVSKSALVDDFDIIIFFRETTPATLLPF
jgi:hypothetical protein